MTNTDPEFYTSKLELDRYKNECLSLRRMTEKIPKTTTLFTWYEVSRLIKAYEEKYNISPCNGLPYEMKSIEVVLSGDVVKSENT